MFHEMGS
jgi:hypothetical protein